jgi:hypothetical protein
LPSNPQGHGILTHAKPSLLRQERPGQISPYYIAQPGFSSGRSLTENRRVSCRKLLISPLIESKPLDGKLGGLVSAAGHDKLSRKCLATFVQILLHYASHAMHARSFFRSTFVSVASKGHSTTVDTAGVSGSSLLAPTISLMTIELPSFSGRHFCLIFLLVRLLE